MLVIIMGGIMRRNYKIIIISVYHISERRVKKITRLKIRRLANHLPRAQVKHLVPIHISYLKKKNIPIHLSPLKYLPNSRT